MASGPYIRQSTVLIKVVEALLVVSISGYIVPLGI